VSHAATKHLALDGRDVTPDARLLHGGQPCDVLVAGSGMDDGTALNAPAVSPLAEVKTHD
jgi:hypothetical protein